MARVFFLLATVLAFGGLSCAAGSESELKVGPVANGSIVPTKQLIRAAGKSVDFHGRPVDLILAPDHTLCFVKDSTSLLAINTRDWTIRQKLALPEKTGSSMHGLATTFDGSKIYFTSAHSLLMEASFINGKLQWGKQIKLPGTRQREGPKGTVESYPCGLALSADNKTAYVCLSMNNSIGVVDLVAGILIKEIEVGIAPYDIVLSKDETTAYVTNWGGRRPLKGDKTSDSGGTKVVVDDRGAGSSGTLGIVALKATKVVGEIVTGLHPSQIRMTRDGSRMYVANANSDSISVIDLSKRAVIQTINVRPDDTLPFGSASNALALSEDEKTLFVANGGNNAIAVVQLAEGASKVQGFIPAGWYPGAVATDGASLFFANIKGTGTRDPDSKKKWGIHDSWGSITKVAIPDSATLTRYTAQVHEDALVPQSLRAWEKAQADQKPLPVPMRIGEPSLIDHVVYIIKENRTYDQVLGDIGKGNSDAKLCIFGKEVTPNHHALADEFALLDNYYCNGVLSPEGHAWAVEGTTVDYLEKTYGAWIRSYPFPGNDALAIAPSGFIWDNVLEHGLTFRNYGEMSTTETVPPSHSAQVLHDHQSGVNKIKFNQKMANAHLKQFSCPDSPGWNLHVPDQVRADVFLKEFAEMEKSGNFPNLTIIYLPSDHTNGTAAAAVTPAAMVADNDLAIGRVVESISHSQFWNKTCIFIAEDDPQNGFDHVDGHRSLALVISPYTKRGAVISKFYNQTSILHTMELMLGLPPMNQMDAMAPAMHEVFNTEADLRPYQSKPNIIPLDQANKQKAAMTPTELKLAEQSEAMRTDIPDAADENTLNRILWASVKGTETPYPTEFAGAHGKGLAALHLKLDGKVKDEDDD